MASNSSSSSDFTFEGSSTSSSSSVESKSVQNKPSSTPRTIVPGSSIPLISRENSQDIYSIRAGNHEKIFGIPLKEPVLELPSSGPDSSTWAAQNNTVQYDSTATTSMAGYGHTYQTHATGQPPNQADHNC
ncbi:unnamed protein product [Adineta ricciae]|uniref:Uncharacterized protein n=1 Tax=Adineta ricciae TaxID=249248 RepID=A0A815IHI7_ADIRI|nr:unnamed protein product [Adineta ricciae]CAF1638960.1 unnamed protein product [Adineta ricciae]